MPLNRSSRRRSVLAVAAASALALAACGGEGGGSEDSVELSFAHSYATTHPQHECGAEAVADELAGNGSGIAMEIFPSSQLGPDGPDRVRSVQEGDIGIDIQGSSAISSLYEPIGALDAAYAFEGADHLAAFAESPAWEALRDDMVEQVQIRPLAFWYFGDRHFTANDPIRSPEDLEGLRMRFPDSPQFLQNAEAMGAAATTVAFEEVYLSLQQGVIDGQENPIPTIAELSLPEVQDYVSLSGHQTGFTVAIVGEQTWQSLSAEQQEALESAVSGASTGVRECLETAEEEVLAQWADGDEITVVDDVDRDAFIAQCEAYFQAELEGEKLELYQAVRELAP
ncbi:TRAP transporter substrate-binding protein DctP [Glycomyces harbinensis]|uniref:Tripartite ATP-independent transporter solute receptor, DctP family n=1 Tax=Glycomyces harbinensis TaxID=58114 RepID=A0A1G6XK36_9ACTN|nr:TRAP transporter substrate-binding protein DctP [Glycomyces harbinensis]SDD78432.1 tripartite ATP-independent transporter solute receptor, DctP family [Glycomyces harbinensis]